MTIVFCNACGYRNPSGSQICASCESPINSSEHTVVLHRVDPLLESLSHIDDIIVDLDEIEVGIPVLVVREGEAMGESFELTQAITTLGRHEDNAIVLDDITVSRQHATIEKTNGRFIVRDNRSLNGTYVNQDRVDVASLEHGDEVQVGKFRLMYLEHPEVGND